MKQRFAFNPGKVRFRATFAAGEMDASKRFGAIDAENGVLNGVQVNLMGEAKGHGVWLGEDFIDGVVAQGNAAKLGIKVRFGHPAMCSDALGTFLGRAKNFSKGEVTRPDGSKAFGAFAEIHLAEEAKKSPSGDLYSWTLATAQNNPDTFGQSIVFTYADFYVLDADGNKHLWSAEEGFDSDDYETSCAAYDSWIGKSADGRRYAVLGDLLGTDFTDSPAATDGVFGTGDLAEQASTMLDENPRILELLTTKPDTVAQFLGRYNAALKAAGKPEVQLAALGVVTPDEYAALLRKCEESEKRLAGLQSAKDKELAAAQAASAASLASAKTDFESQLARLTTDLAAAAAALSAETEARAQADQALAATREQLAAKQSALARLTGGTLNSVEAFASWQEASAKLGYTEARRTYPELHAAFMQAPRRKG